MISLELFGTAGCHLCEEAEALLQAAIARESRECKLKTRDIADDAAWLDQYGVRIPVVRDTNTGTELEWPFGPDELHKFLNPLTCPSG